MYNYNHFDCNYVVIVGAQWMVGVAQPVTPTRPPNTPKSSSKHETEKQELPVVRISPTGQPSHTRRTPYTGKSCQQLQHPERRRSPLAPSLLSYTFFSPKALFEDDITVHSGSCASDTPRGGGRGGGPGHLLFLLFRGRPEESGEDL